MHHLWEELEINKPILKQDNLLWWVSWCITGGRNLSLFGQSQNANLCDHNWDALLVGEVWNHPANLEQVTWHDFQPIKTEIFNVIFRENRIIWYASLVGGGWAYSANHKTEKFIVIVVGMHHWWEELEIIQPITKPVNSCDYNWDASLVGA